jgi:hypothetical protein
MAKTQVATALVSSASNAAGGTTRARIDCTGVDGGFITIRMTNGGVAPSVQCVARILAAHKGSSMPTAAAEGTADLDWKQVMEVGAGLTVSTSTRSVYRFGPEASYLEVEFTGNTGQAVTVEAHATTYTYA